MPPTIKPPPLRPGDAIRVLSLSSPVEESHFLKGCDELVRLGYVPKFDRARVLARDGYFAGSAADRSAALREASGDAAARAIFCSRGGYGANYLLDSLSAPPAPTKILLGASDITSLQVFLWQKFRCVTFYGPLVAMNFNRGAGAPHGYDLDSFTSAVTQSEYGWSLGLHAESLFPGVAEGVLLGGCFTLVETALGTPWQLDTRGAILILEDLLMKPYQVDRALMHLAQAGSLGGLAGVILGEFPQCDALPGDETVKDVTRRILGPLGIPVVWGAPIGHTARAMLTIPLGVRARLSADGNPRLEILEPACAP